MLRQTNNVGWVGRVNHTSKISVCKGEKKDFRFHSREVNSINKILVPTTFRKFHAARPLLGLLALNKILRESSYALRELLRCSLADNSNHNIFLLLKKANNLEKIIIYKPIN